MSVKILVTRTGQQIIADTKQVSRKEDEVLIAYWVSDPRVVIYSQNEDETISVRFAPYCMVSDEREFSIKEDFIVSILEPRDDVLESYTLKVKPNESSLDSVEDGSNPDDTDGTTTGGTESTFVPTDVSLGEDEVVPATVA